MRTTKLTLPFNVTVAAVIGAVRIMRGERSMLLLPLEPQPIVKNPEEQIVYAPETFGINMTSDVGRRIACDDLRLALPEHLSAGDEELLIKVLRDKLRGKTVLLYKTQQKNDATKFNVRLAPALAEANDDELLKLIRSMSAKPHDDLATAAGNYPADPNDPGF